MQVSDGQARSVTSYAYKASLIGSAHRFELTDEGFSWHIAGRSGVCRYDEISAIRLSFRPVSMQQHRFRADVSRASGGRIAILSTSWWSANQAREALKVFLNTKFEGGRHAGRVAKLSKDLTK